MNRRVLLMVQCLKIDPLSYQTLYSYEVSNFLLQLEHLKVFMLFISGEILHKIKVIFLDVEKHTLSENN